MRTLYELRNVAYEDFTLEEKKWYAQLRLRSTSGEDYKRWYNIYNELCGVNETFDDVMNSRQKQSTPTTERSIDYSSEREYKNF